MSRKGMTLIEVILAIAILSIIAIGFLSSMTTSFKIISQGRETTENVFSAQRELEENIESIKEAIVKGNDPNASLSDKVEYTLFSGVYRRQIEGYKTEADITGNNKLVTVVSSEQLKYPVPTINNIGIKMYDNNGDIPKNYEYVKKPNLSLRGTVTLSDPENVFLVNRHEWFVSRRGYSIPMEINPNLIIEGDVGRLYPVFPYDYDLVPIGESTNQLNQSNISSLLSEYAGRHIIYTVSPYALSGKKGETVFSQPIYAHGPIITEGLVLHLDASLISKDPTISDINVNGDNISVNRWNDTSVHGNHLSSSGSAAPLLEEVQYQENVYAWGKSLSQNGINSTTMSRASFNNSPSNQMTVFVVARINEINTSTSIVSGGSWDFGWNNEGNLCYRIGGDYSTAASTSTGTGIDGKLHVFAGVVSGGNISFRIDGVTQSSGSTTGILNSSPFIVNLDGVDISEILLYDNALSDSTSLLEVENYLINKYNPDPNSLSNILLLKSISSQTIMKNDIFAPPNPVDAVMTNGTTQKVYVNWENIDSVDTSTIGSYTLNGHAVMDNTKTTSMTVNVAGIDRLERHINPLVSGRGIPMILPTTLKAVLTNGSTSYVSVEWSSNSPNLSISNGNILAGNVAGEVTNGITATAISSGGESISYDVDIKNSYNVKFKNSNGTLIKEESVIENGSAVAPADPERKGYSFIRWNGTYDNVTSNRDILAVHQANTYTVTFDHYYSGSSNTSKTVTYDSTYGTLPSPTRNNYNFEGWYTEDKTRILNSTTVTTADNHTLYAGWSEDSRWSCPFIYSFDGKDYHLEHESFPFAIFKTLETTSYKGLQHLKMVESKYHIEIREELDEISFINGFSIRAVDYPADRGIQAVYSDIFGNPHTIKNTVFPDAFYDSYGNDRLKELLESGQLIGSDKESLNEGQYVSTFEAVFNKPEDTEETAKLIVSTQKTLLTTQLGLFYLDKVNATENMWWMERVLSMPALKDKLLDFMNVINLRVELWDGENWLPQGEVKAGLHVLEEFLIPIDLKSIDPNEESIKVRFVSGTGLFEIDQVTIDYSKNEITDIQELELSSAKYNENKDVVQDLKVSDDDSRIRMVTGDKIELIYDAPELVEGYNRGFIASITGYYYMDQSTVEKSIPASLKDIQSAQEVYEILKMFDHKTIYAIPKMVWLNQLMDEVYMKSLEEKVEKIVGEVFMEAN